MIIGPSTSELLEAVALFLTKDLRPTVTDPALAFRTLIAGSVVGALAGELRKSQALDDAQRERLAQLGFAGADRSVADIEGALVAALRRGELGDTGDVDHTVVWGHAKASLAEMLRLTNPRFDLGQNVD